MPLTRSVKIESGIINETPCDWDFACLSCAEVCRVEPFIDRDLHLLRCRDDRACSFARSYQGQRICSCPVNKASYGIN